MTGDDAARMQIAQLLATATQTGDEGDNEAYVACFTEDGSTAFGSERVTGRAAILAWRDTQLGGSKTPMHHLTTSRITLTSDRAARARSYWLFVDEAGVGVAGCYDDRLEREDDGWRIAERITSVTWSAAPL